MTLMEEHLSLGTPVRSDRGAIVYAAGAPADRIYFVWTGSVLVEKFDGAGKPTLVHVYGSGEYFGESSLGRMDGVWTETARVLGRGAKIIAWSSYDVCRRAAADSAFSDGIREMLIRKIGERDRRLEIARFKLVKQRLAAILTDLADRMGERGENGEISLPSITHQRLADMVGTSRELVTSSMIFLRKRGYVRYSRKCGIVILRAANLRTARWYKSKSVSRSK